jgi:hypothetical protein
MIYLFYFYRNNHNFLNINDAIANKIESTFGNKLNMNENIKQMHQKEIETIENKWRNRLNEAMKQNYEVIKSNDTNSIINIISIT